LPQSLSEGLRALSRQSGVTLFMTLLAAFKTLLYRYTGQEDIVVGTPIAGRNRAETEGLIGFFLNTLVLRTNLSGNPSFRELLGRVREVALGAYAHQDLPFEKLVEELKPERDLSRTPLFQVMLNMLNLPEKEIELPGMRLESIGRRETESKFDLTLYVKDRDQRLYLDLVYNADLFEQVRMAEMLKQFEHLLKQIIDNPGRSIQSYSLVTPQSARLLPDPATVLPELRCELVTSLVTSWAKQSPKKTAIRQGERAWTYEELSASAGALGQLLGAHRTQWGEVVAVAGPKSFGLVSSMMAVLLSGGVLLAVDRNLPADRQRLMLREAGAKRLLYIGAWRKQDEWMQELSELTILRVAQNEAGGSDTEGLSNLGAKELPELSPDDAAYIFFTSGTTGVPRGVMGCHKGLSHFLTWQRETFSVGPEDRCAQLTGLSFDVVLRDIFLPLISGSTLSIPEETDELVSEHVLPWLEREGITLLHTVPSLAQSWMVSAPPTVTLSSLRWVFFAGEPLTGSLVRRWRESFPDSGQIVNLYGPTETTLAKCFYTVPTQIASGVQPVGRPLPQTQALVLTENGQVCGIGEPGEIVLRTPFRSLGYINAPEEQRKRFVANPFRDNPADLIYFSGDRGRYRPDGSLEILGRLDNQIKIRGVRVEPDEVTAILSQHPDVSSCVVVGRTNAQDENILVGYVVASARNQVKVREIRSYLSKALPSAMVPSVFVFLDALPLTPNGKVDRKALPAPDQTRPELERAFVAPRSPVEKELARIWSEVLKLKQVGVYDNFFELGGHSLLATQVMSRVCKAFQTEVPLRTLFEKPTIEELAEVIEKTLLEEIEKLTEDEAQQLLKRGT
ncbi:MAG: amino acid adenylation domain-containing protein, partial [Deltaproteobacteria bacterium]|nr:amino acid adenylation domain-containing protein [Deltaproteobacteria bacterium]